MKLTDPDGKPFVGSTVVADLRQGGRIHLRRLERAGDQGVLLEVAARSITRTRETSLRALIRQPDAARANTGCKTSAVFGECGRWQTDGEQSNCKASVKRSRMAEMVRGGA